MVHTQDMSLTALDQYRREVSRIPQLTDEEETRLLGCIERRKLECPQQCRACAICVAAQQARTRLVEGYQHLVSRLAWRHASRNQELYLDLAQEGNLGLLRAISNDGLIRLPWRKVEAIRQLEQVCDELAGVLGREPTVEEIAQEMQVTTREVCERFVLREQCRVMSLDAPMDASEEVRVEDMLEDISSPAGGEASLEDVLHHLTDQELAVVLVRFGLGEHQVHTQREAARVLGMELRKVQLVEHRARLCLRQVLEEQAS